MSKSAGLCDAHYRNIRGLGASMRMMCMYAGADADDKQYDPGGWDAAEWLGAGEYFEGGWGTEHPDYHLCMFRRESMGARRALGLVGFFRVYIEEHSDL